MAYVITNYLDIANSAASPTNVWFAQNSTDSGNNTGWSINANSYVFCNYLSIVDSAATPGNTWYAQNSLDNGNNTGWIFSDLPPTPVAAQEYPISLRSFTVQRRF